MKMLHIIMAAFLAASLVSTDDNIPAECMGGNYKNLEGIYHEHRHFDYRDNSGERDTLNDVHEHTKNYSVGFDNWFRFRFPQADRLMELDDLQRNIYNDSDLVRILIFIATEYLQ